MRIKPLSLIFIISFFMLSISAKAGKSDSLLMANGDVMVGEIKDLNKGVVTFKTMYSDKDFKIEWDKVVGIFSKRYFLVSLTNGLNLNGRLRSDISIPGKTVIHYSGAQMTLNIQDIVFIQVVEKRFISRLNADISLGYTYTKSNNQTQFSVRSNLGYNASKWGAKASFNSVISSQDSLNTTRRTDGSVGARLLVGRGWFTSLTTNFLQNSEQKLKLRATTQGAAGYLIVNKRKMYLSTSLGLAWNNEQYNEEGQSVNNSIEAYVGLDYNIFNMEDLSLITGFSLYPGITEKGRIRFDFSFDIKYDLPLDFFINLGYSYNYDNRPIEGASDKDYVIQTTFGWEL